MLWCSHPVLAAKVKAHELRGKGKQELLNQLKELKSELTALRVAKVRPSCECAVSVLWLGLRPPRSLVGNKHLNSNDAACPFHFQHVRLTVPLALQPCSGLLVC